MCKQARTALPAASRSISAARAWAAEGLAGLYAAMSRGVADDVALIVSELATNCVRSGASRFELALDAHHERLTIAVSDTAPGMPAQGNPNPLSASGRGLNIVAALSDRWGVTPHDAGKTVWAQLVVPRSSRPGFACRFADGVPG